LEGAAQHHGRIGKHGASCRVHCHGVLAPGIFDRDLALANIKSDALGIAFEGIAPAAGAS